MFDKPYEQWMEGQLKSRTGEAFRKLREDHGYAEKLFAEQVWYPLFGDFEFLHAEFEVPHARNSSYYLDYAFIRLPHMIDWEIDDFGSHGKNINRRGFDYERERQNFLMLNGWQVYRFSLDAVKERPLQCRQFILQVMGKLFGGQQPDLAGLSVKKKEIMRYALRKLRPIVPAEVCSLLGVHGQHARALLRELAAEGLLLAHSGKRDLRVRAYSLGPKAPSRIM